MSKCPFCDRTSAHDHWDVKLGQGIERAVFLAGERKIVSEGKADSYGMSSPRRNLNEKRTRRKSTLDLTIETKEDDRIRSWVKETTDSETGSNLTTARLRQPGLLGMKRMGQW